MGGCFRKSPYRPNFCHYLSALHTHTRIHSSPVVHQKETLITPAHKGRYCMNDSSFSAAALRSTANFKHHITGALKQKDFYIFFINLGWLLRLTLCIIYCNCKYKKNKEKKINCLYRMSSIRWSGDWGVLQFHSTIHEPPLNIVLCVIWHLLCRYCRFSQ